VVVSLDTLLALNDISGVVHVIKLCAGYDMGRSINISHHCRSVLGVQMSATWLSLVTYHLL
jgi:hypothetical protein